MTHGHELKWGNAGGREGTGQRRIKGRKNGTAVIAQSIKYILKKKNNVLEPQCLLLEQSESKTLKTPNTGEVVEQQELAFIAGGNAKWYSHFGRHWWFLIKLNMLLWYDPAITLLNIYLNELKTYLLPPACTQMFIAALFIKCQNILQQMNG